MTWPMKLEREHRLIKPEGRGWRPGRGVHSESSAISPIARNGSRHGLRDRLGFAAARLGEAPK